VPEVNASSKGSYLLPFLYFLEGFSETGSKLKLTSLMVKITYLNSLIKLMIQSENHDPRYNPLLHFHCFVIRMRRTVGTGGIRTKSVAFTLFFGTRLPYFAPVFRWAHHRLKPTSARTIPEMNTVFTLLRNPRINDT